MEKLKVKNRFSLPIYIWTSKDEIRGLTLRIEVWGAEDSPHFVALEIDKEGFWCITQYDEDSDWFKVHYYHNVRDLLASMFLGDFYSIIKTIKRIRGE